MSRAAFIELRIPRFLSSSSLWCLCPSLSHLRSYTSEQWLSVSLRSLFLHPFTTAAQIIQLILCHDLSFLRCTSPPLLLLFPCRLLLTLQVTKPLSSPFSPSPLLLSLLPSQQRFITPLSSPPSAPVDAPHSHTCAVFSHIHAHSHTLPLCLCASGCLLMHVACFACPPPISLSLFLSFSLSFSLLLSPSLSLSLLSPAAAHTAVPLQAGSRFLAARENISANEERQQYFPPCQTPPI